ncbi:MAG: DUF2997 domain-containing protein [Nitrospirae bacterium]|nr:DUF2997 domain-containing protein [Nitrospirota bacterium]MBU6482852.1 DUF2997 domain-containing protein [Nitrospirota bacterium]MDE3041626.1 DUF2997 domain-containing protein [Nitrospirota bacterium]MDE3219012.1 DUF2997 domain-containing protein [Nitrospirota bacterium]
MSQVKVKISRTGQVTIEVLNAQGMQCRTLTKVLEQALGETVKGDLKPEYFEVAQTAHDTLQH